MTLSLQTNWYWILLFCITVLTSLFFSYRHWKYAVRHRSRIFIMELIRTTVILIIAFTLLRPELVFKTVLTSDPEVVVLHDVSGSMKTRDMVVKSNGAPHAIPREEWVNRQLEKKFYIPLTQKFKVSVTSFSMPQIQLLYQENYRDEQLL